MEEGKKESYRVVWGFGPRTLLTVEYSRKQQQCSGASNKIEVEEGAKVSEEGEFFDQT